MSRAGRAPAWLARSALGLFGAVVWLSILALPAAPVIPNLDFSWMMSYAYFQEHGLQAGIDYVYTYGPLGFLPSIVYDARLFDLKLVWELSFKLLVVVLALRRFRRLPHPGERVLCAAALIFLLPDPDTIYLTGIFLAGALVIEEAERPGRLALGLPILALLAWVKFSFFPLALGSALAAVIAGSLRRGAGYGSATLLGAAGAFGALWVASGQALAHLPTYLRLSFAMASGYDEAMGLEVRPQTLLLGAVLLALNAAGIGSVAWVGRRNPTRLLLCGLAAAALFVAWKHGFVRNVGFTFFCVAGLLPFLLFAPEPGATVVRRAQAAWRGAAFALGLAGVLLHYHGVGATLPRLLRDYASYPWRVLANLGDLEGWRTEQERSLESMRREVELPRIRARVGEASLDIVSYRQAVVLLNGFHWRPRPVFQSFAAYTPELSRLNAAFYRSERAPRFVLFQLETIDGRFPGLDDAAALQVLLHEYEPVMTEGTFLLLERRAASSPRTGFGETLLERNVSLEESVDVGAWSHEPLVLHVELRYAALGRLRTLLLSGPRIFLEVRLVDGRKYGYRLLPRLAGEGFVLSPWLGSQAGFVAWRSGHGAPRVASFRLLAEGGDRFVHGEARVKLVRDPTLEPSAASELVRYPMLEPQPERVVSLGTVAFRALEGRIALVVPAPGEVRFRLPPGSFVLEGWYGLAPSAPGGEQPQPVDFGVEAVDAEGRRTPLFERRLSPRRRPGDRVAQRLRVPFEARSATELLLQTQPGPRGAGAASPYWAEVRVSTVTPSQPATIRSGSGRPTLSRRSGTTRSRRAPSRRRAR